MLQSFTNLQLSGLIALWYLCKPQAMNDQILVSVKPRAPLHVRESRFRQSPCTAPSPRRPFPSTPVCLSLAVKSWPCSPSVSCSLWRYFDRSQTAGSDIRLQRPLLASALHRPELGGAYPPRDRAATYLKRQWIPTEQMKIHRPWSFVLFLVDCCPWIKGWVGWVWYENSVFQVTFAPDKGLE